MYSVKQTLDDILDYAYADDPNLCVYKRFYIDVSDKNMSSKHGDYLPSEHRIRIFNTSNRPDSWVTVTTLHELSHHVDYCQRGRTDHQLPFYFVFITLLRAGLDLGIYSKDDVLNSLGHAQDSNKVIDAIEFYEPKNIGYKSDKTLIQAYDCFAEKDALKARGYSWNKVRKTWEKEVTNVDEEKEFLETHEIKYATGSASLKSYKKITEK